MRVQPLFVSLALLPLLGAGCISISSGHKKAATGGVFKSVDKGVTWIQKVALPTSKGVQSIAGVDISTIAFDPGDPNALYLGSVANGLFYSYDAGESWQRAGDLTTGNVSVIAVHPREKCMVYAAVANRLFQSTDCSRSFQVIYTDPRSAATITALVIDWFNPRQLYLTTGTGELSRSTDGGGHWSPVRRWDDGLAELVMSAGDSRKLWVATRGQGMWLTEDAGATWQDLKKTMEPFEGARAFFAMAEDRAAPGTIMHASRFGLLKSTDSGHTWQKMNILTPPQAVTITSLAINPKNSQEVYYTTATKLYTSRDGGTSWATAEIPSNRTASTFAIDPANDAVLYLGVVQPKK